MRRTATLLSAFALLLTTATACTGDPDAPATVGPTAGPDQEPSYEPSTFPYESTVELSDADREQIDELLLLIDEYTEYTSGISTEHSRGFERLKPQLSQEVIKETEKFRAEVEKSGISPEGEVVISNALIDRYTANQGAEVWVCFDYGEYTWVKDGKPASNEEQAEERLFLYTAKYENGWILAEDIYHSPSCEELNV